MPQTRTAQPELKAPSVFKAFIQLDQRTLSPSALESWAKCSLRYSLERLFHLQDAEEWDPATEDALKTGEWIHSCLENFFEAPDWESPRTRLTQTLLDRHQELFAATSTPSYLKLIETQAGLLAQKLERHVLEFERPLAQMRLEQKPLREFSVEGILYGQKFRGIVDRIDRLPGNRLLLWDYKTGAVRETKAESQFKQGRFQWFIYRELLKSFPELADCEVIGGGYINPLDASKSALFLFEDHAGEFNAPLASLFEINGHGVQFIDAALEAKTNEALAQSVLDFLDQMRTGEVRARPLKDSECQRCPHDGGCGRPYLSGEPA